MRAMVPFFSRLEKPARILVAGCGGGFDVFAGVPIAQYLMAMGKSVVFANFSFSNLWLCGGERVTPTMWRGGQTPHQKADFLGKKVGGWLHAKRQKAPVLAFAESGGRPLSAAPSWVIDQQHNEPVVLVD